MASGARLAAGSAVPGTAAELAALQAALGVPGPYPAEAVAEAGAAAGAVDPSAYDDETGRELVTLDPPGSMDLDQAFGLRLLDGRGPEGGWEVDYAIADVGAVVRPGGALDAETRRRGETLYLPDRRVPLHPDVLGEGSASLLPGQVRPAVLWTLRVDADGAVVGETRVRRALVRSRARLDYPSAQAALDAGTATGPLALLPGFGRARLAAGRARGAVTLPEIEREVVPAPGVPGGLTVVLRTPEPCEGWNAELSLLVGMAAGVLQLDAGVGLLRVLPPPRTADVEPVRALALGLGVAWPQGTPWGTVVGALDPAVPAHAAVVAASRRLLRGAGYLPVTPGLSGPAAEHSAIASVYAHATAPLRRLADRWVSETCLAVAAGREVPAWVTEGLPLLPGLMHDADGRSHTLDRQTLDLVEAALLAGRVGEQFDAVALSATATGGTVALVDPPVICRCSAAPGSALPVGAPLRVRLTRADVHAREVEVAQVA